MSHTLTQKHTRRAVRRAVTTTGQAVGMAEFRLLGERILDVSPAGLLLACDAQTVPGEPLLVSFQVPVAHGQAHLGAQEARFIDAEAEVARVVQGFREGDPGYCAGLRFTYMERSDRHELLARLAGYPPPVPRPRVQPQRATHGPAVLVRPILNLAEVPIPLTRRRYRAPRGAFC